MERSENRNFEPGIKRNIFWAKSTSTSLKRPIDNFLKETKLSVRAKFGFDYVDEPKSKASFGFFGLSGLSGNKRIETLFNRTLLYKCDACDWEVEEGNQGNKYEKRPVGMSVKTVERWIRFLSYSSNQVSNTRKKTTFWRSSSSIIEKLSIETSMAMKETQPLAMEKCIFSSRVESTLNGRFGKIFYQKSKPGIKK